MCVSRYKPYVFGADRNIYGSGKLSAVIEDIVYTLKFYSAVFGMTFEEVHLSYEIRDKLIARVSVDIYRISHLLQNSGVYHENTVRHGHCFALVMRDIYYVYIQSVLYFLYLKPHSLPQLCVKI